MKKDIINIDGKDYPVISLNTMVVGSGAAGLNAALQLYESGIRNIAVITEKLGSGTSNNAGSDKQTYYKQSFDAQSPDSAYEMAEDLFCGGCMHGDIALCEAQYSIPAFYNLIRLGVPFPHDDFGSYPGYITDHDKKGRGTSAGPLTSRFMVSALLKALRDRGVDIIEKYQIISLLYQDLEEKRKVTGALACGLNSTKGGKSGILVINAVNIVLATGGPGDLYRHSVYPESQKGSIGMALRIGAEAQMLTESQFGLASIKHRWNLSGSYQQVIPRYFSTDQVGNDEEDFLNDFYPDNKSLWKAIFLKGYQWPFDPRKINNYGSSLIDLLVFREISFRNRRVFLDYSSNPSKDSTRGFSLEDLPEEAGTYLRNSGAVQHKPIDRLAQLNQPAIDLYLSNGIDLRKEPLEIAVCSQHNNGGLKADIWWESNVKNLFPAGEINGTHGIYRPGGSALNSGQVGGFRAALKIRRDYSNSPPEPGLFLETSRASITKEFDLMNRFKTEGIITAEDCQEDIRNTMSSCAAHIRIKDNIDREVKRVKAYIKALPDKLNMEGLGLTDAYRSYDMAIAQLAYLESIRNAIEKGIGSRGSYLIMNPDGLEAHPNLGPDWNFHVEEGKAIEEIQEIYLDEEMDLQINWVKPRPIPNERHWFETLWRKYRNKA